MIKAIVSGPAGRMGGRIIHMIEAAAGHPPGRGLRVAGPSPRWAKMSARWWACRPRGSRWPDSLDEVLGQGDVVIEFTHPEPSLAHLREVADAGKAMVLGTTGFSPAQVAEIHALGARTRLVFAPNMSVGVNLMFKVVADIARVLSEGYDVEIVEAHHRLKKDAPSGTALKLAQVIAHALDRDLEKVGVYARHGIIGPAHRQRDRHPDGAGRGHRRRAHRALRRHRRAPRDHPPGPQPGQFRQGRGAGGPVGRGPAAGLL